MRLFLLLLPLALLAQENECPGYVFDKQMTILNSLDSVEKKAHLSGVLVTLMVVPPSKAFTILRVGGRTVSITLVTVITLLLHLG